jgi:E3 ubiquitin-protein ligase BRE1
MLVSKYSVIVSDHIKLKQTLDETRNLLELNRTTFQRQTEQMEIEELANQKRLGILECRKKLLAARLCNSFEFQGNEMMHLEDQLSTVRKENEILRIEYEQNLAANEQTGPINKEMRSLITTLQTNNKLLKSDNARTKKRLQELQDEYEKYKNDQKEKFEKIQQQSTDAQETTVHSTHFNDYEALKNKFEILLGLNVNDDTIKDYLSNLIDSQSLIRGLIDSHMNGNCVIGTSA